MEKEKFKEKDRIRRKKSAMRLLLAAGGGGLNKVQLSCPNTGIVAVPETDRWTGSLSFERRRGKEMEGGRGCAVVEALESVAACFSVCLWPARCIRFKYEGQVSVANCRV